MFNKKSLYVTLIFHISTKKLNNTVYLRLNLKRNHVVKNSRKNTKESL